MDSKSIHDLLETASSMGFGLASTLILIWVVVSAPAIAKADIIQDLTFSQAITSCNLDSHPCDADAGSNGGAASGHADFSDTPNTPWSFNFVTGPATSWSDVSNHYNAAFDCASPCGSFTMAGPYGLTFSGQIIFGHSQSDIRGDSVGVDFQGYWSTGIYGYGHADVTSGFNFSADLQTFAQAPEPSSLLMLGSGVLGLVGLVRRRLLGETR